MDKAFNPIHADDRGEIFTLMGFFPEDREISIFTTKKGFARGGCVHKDSEEFAVVLDGMIEAHMGTVTTICNKGESFYVPQNTPHYFIALTDCLVAEWNPKPEEKKCKDPETRAVVDAINQARQ